MDETESESKRDLFFAEIDRLIDAKADAYVEKYANGRGAWARDQLRREKRHEFTKAFAAYMFKVWEINSPHGGHFLHA